MAGEVARTAADLQARYGALLTPPPQTGDPTGQACAALDAAAERLRGPRSPGQLTLEIRDG